MRAARGLVPMLSVATGITVSQMRRDAPQMRAGSPSPAPPMRAGGGSALTPARRHAPRPGTTTPLDPLAART